MARQVRVLERLTAGRNPYVPAGNTCNILPPCISPTLALPLCLFLPTLPPSPSHHTFAHVYARGIAHRTIAIARSPLTYPPSIHPSIYLSIYTWITNFRVYERRGSLARRQQAFRPSNHGAIIRKSSRHRITGPCPLSPPATRCACVYLHTRTPCTTIFSQPPVNPRKISRRALRSLKRGKKNRNGFESRRGSARLPFSFPFCFPLLFLFFFSRRRKR